MPSDVAMRLMNAGHRVLLKVSGGRLGWDIGRMPVLELTTTGRKSGQRRSTMLTAPLRINGSYVVVASRGGDDAHPAWYLNLLADPRVEYVAKGAPPVTALARVATPAERAELWPRITRDHPNYAGYQERTTREIPLVFLDPV